jgi:hypothetical protein
MKIKFIFILAIILTALTAANAQGKVHSPAKGSAERAAILEALRGGDALKFQVHYLKVHNGWAWIDTTPLDTSGRPVAEGGPNLLHFESGKWMIIDLSTVPEDPNDPLGPEDASKVFVANIRKTFAGVPADIFPKPSH